MVTPSKSWAGGRRTGRLSGWLQTLGTMTGETKVQQYFRAAVDWCLCHIACLTKQEVYNKLVFVSFQVSSRSSVEMMNVVSSRRWLQEFQQTSQMNPSYKRYSNQQN